jgi:hypothetical protein
VGDSLPAGGSVRLRVRDADTVAALGLVVSLLRKVGDLVEGLDKAVRDGFSGLHGNELNPVWVAGLVPAAMDVNIKSSQACLEVCGPGAGRVQAEVWNPSAGSSNLPLGVYLASAS